MPKLAFFAPCEKLIIDEGDQSISLITVLQSFDVGVAESKPLPVDAAVGKEWDAVAVWYVENDADFGKTFRQRIDFVRPDGNVQFQSTIEFTMTKPWHRNKTHVTGMPIGLGGKSELRLWLLDGGKETSREPLAVYPIFVSHRKFIPEPAAR